MKKINGFTLIEVMIVIAIIGILAAIALGPAIEGDNTVPQSTEVKDNSCVIGCE